MTFSMTVSTKNDIKVHVHVHFLENNLFHDGIKIVIESITHSMTLDSKTAKSLRGRPEKTVVESLICSSVTF